MEKRTAKEIYDCKKSILDREIKNNKKISQKALQDLKNCNKHTPSIIKKENVFLNFLDNAKKYILTELTHAIIGAVEKQEFNKRKNSCLTCHGRVDSIDGKTDPGGIGFCSLCGCGASKRAALSVKLTLAGVDCPINKWEPVKTKGSIKLNYKNIIESLFGFTDSLFFYIQKLLKNYYFILRQNVFIFFRK